MTDSQIAMVFIVIFVVVLCVLADMKKTRRRKYKSRKWVNYPQKPDRARDQNTEQQGVLEKQLEALRSTTIKTKRPVNRSAFQIWLALERAIKIHAPRSRVMPEVGMGAFLNTSSDGQISWDDKEAFRAFVAKRVDFLVVDDFGNPAFAVEYHGSGHYIGDTAASRDVVKREALRLAGVELVEVHGHTSDTERDALFVGAIQRNCKVQSGQPDRLRTSR